TENVSHLVKVSGIGGKIAEKIILELRGKLGKAGEMEAGMLRDESDVVEALYSLGYSQKEAREALKEISEEIIGTGEKVKEALKILGKNKK
ncbi:MAG: Holliday junction branch migration protein RuvA, partial [Candidatus Zambryskibacteria bacterium CG_4_9_14_3_um_filter_40_16]